MPMYVPAISMSLTTTAPAPIVVLGQIFMPFFIVEPIPTWLHSPIITSPPVVTFGEMWV